jgi:hypothetical protein
MVVAQAVATIVDERLGDLVFRVRPRLDHLVEPIERAGKFGVRLVRDRIALRPAIGLSLAGGRPVFLE